MTTQPEALRLADWLEHQVPMTPDLRAQASAELRRLREIEAAYGVMMGQTDDPAIHYCHRFAILMECVMLGGVDKYWDEMGTLLDEYHKARDAWMTAHGQPYVSGFGKD